MKPSSPPTYSGGQRRAPSTKAGYASRDWGFRSKAGSLGNRLGLRMKLAADALTTDRSESPARTQDVEQAPVRREHPPPRLTRRLTARPKEPLHHARATIECRDNDPLKIELDGKRTIPLAKKSTPAVQVQHESHCLLLAQTLDVGRMMCLRIPHVWSRRREPPTMTDRPDDLSSATAPPSAFEVSTIEPIRPRPGRFQAALQDIQRAYDELPELQRPKLTGWFRTG